MAEIALARPRLRAHSLTYRRRKIVNLVMGALVTLCCAAALLALVTILVYVVIQGLPALNLAFFTEARKPLGEPGGGVGPAIVGSLIMLAVGAAIGLVIGLGAGIFLSEFGRGPFPSAVRFISDLLAGMPSVAIGVFVWAFLVRDVFGSFSGLAGGVALGIIMIPLIARTVE